MNSSLISLPIILALCKIPLTSTCPVLWDLCLLRYTLLAEYVWNGCVLALPSAQAFLRVSADDLFIYLWSLWSLVILEISVCDKLDWSQWGCWGIIWRKWERQAAQVGFLWIYTGGLCHFRYLCFWLLFVKAAHVL